MFDWLDHIVTFIVYTWLNLDPSGSLGKSLHFFIFDSTKILLLLIVISFLMGIVNTFFPVEKIRDSLSNRNWFGLQYVVAASFGAITPFCSCSSVPLFIGFVKGGIPLGVTFAFLITSPLVNEVALAIFLGMFGIKFTLTYLITGILAGSAGGWVLSRLSPEKHLADWVKEIHSQNQFQDQAMTHQSGFKDQVLSIIHQSIQILQNVVGYVLIGIGVGAFIHGYVPDEFFLRYLATDQWWALPAAVILSIPLYAGATGIIPVIQVLIAKGIPIGTAIAFMMGTIGLSFPEAILLKKVMNTRLITYFFAVVFILILIIGFFYNWIFN